MPEKSLLLVDDEQYILNSLKRVLRRDGYQITTATSGEEGLRLCTEQIFQVVISDQRMPGMSGTEFLRQLKRDFPDTVRIVLSGYAELDSVTQAVNEGAIYKFITKPWEDNELRAAIQEAFEYHDLRSENLRLNRELTLANEKLTKQNLDIRNSYQALFDRSNDAILIINELGRIEFANPAAVKLLRKDKCELVGCSVDLSSLNVTSEVRLSENGADPLYAKIQSIEVKKEGQRAFLITIHNTTDSNRIKKERIENQRRTQIALLKTIEAIALTIEKRDPYTSGHQSRVADLAFKLGRQLGLEPFRLEGLRLSASIHDIGKIYIPAEILNRPGQLNEAEYGIVRAHPQVGFDILSKIDFSWPVAQIVLQHHERLDGTGYPNKIKGNSVIIEARILAVADTVESMLSHRPYRSAIPLPLVMEQLDKDTGKGFDSDVVRACQTLFVEHGYQLPDADTVRRQPEFPLDIDWKEPPYLALLHNDNDQRGSDAP